MSEAKENSKPSLARLSGRKRSLALFFAGLVVAGGLLIFALIQSMPSYLGHSAESWFQEYLSGPAYPTESFANKFRAMGPDGVRFLAMKYRARTSGYDSARLYVWRQAVMILDRPPSKPFTAQDSASAAARLLRALGKDAAPVAPDLIEVLRSGDNKRIFEAVQLLAVIGPAAGSAVPELERLLDDPQHRFPAIQALVSIQPGNAKLFTVLREELHDTDEAKRRTAIIRLVETGRPVKELTPLLEPLRHDPVISIQSEAFGALAKLDPKRPDIIPTLKQSLHQGGDPRLVMGTLVRVGAKELDILPMLLDELKSNTNSQARIEIVQALGWIGNDARAALPQIEGCLTDANPQLRSAAFNAKRRIETDKTAVIDHRR